MKIIERIYKEEIEEHYDIADMQHTKLEEYEERKSKMDAAMDMGEKRGILQSIGSNILLVEREIGKKPNGRVLTAKFIEVEPYPWLEFLEKSSKKLAPILDKGLNNGLQGELGQKSDLYCVWLGWQE